MVIVNDMTLDQATCDDFSSAFVYVSFCRLVFGWSAGIWSRHCATKPIWRLRRRCGLNACCLNQRTGSHTDVGGTLTVQIACGLNLRPPSAGRLRSCAGVVVLVRLNSSFILCLVVWE